MSGLAAGVLGYWAFEAPRSSLRLWAAIGACLAAIAYPVVWWRAAPPTEEGRLWRRVGRFVLLVLLSVLALGGAAVGVAVLLGWALADLVDPLNLHWMYLGLFMLVLTIGALVAWWARSFQCIVLRRRNNRWVTGLLTLLLIGGGLWWLNERKIPGELDRAGRELARQAGLGRYDVLLVIDPADIASRQLIRAARRDVAAGRGSRLFSPPALNVRYDVAFGLAVPLPLKGATAALAAR